MTYADAIQFLTGLQVFGARPGLETPLKLAVFAGNPQNQLRFIHVAGTNGKGSTCAMLESIYRAAGLKAGLYTSPHLVSFRERIQVNRQLISEADVARLVAEMRDNADGTPISKSADAEPEFGAPGTAATQPTFFEFVTIMALRHFAKQKCDVVIWETGLGGRLDATNIVTPLASVITNISLDHTAWLGDTLAQIAAEKAGIIKPGVPVLTAENKSEAFEVISIRARELAAPLVTVGNIQHSTFNIQLPLPGEHQRTNAALALATVEALQKIIPVSAEAIQRGLATVDWPGRFQIIRRGAQTLVLDGAHNPAGVEALRAALQTHFPNQKPALIVGVLADKDWPAMARILAGLADKLFVVSIQSARGLPPEEFAVALRRENPRAEVVVSASLAEALEKSAREPLLAVTGSLYLIGAVLEQSGLAGGGGERALNEYHAVKK
ncbi:MAG: bifunctional folylpolyglutamate synthase/dihydrofolate synthase [Verrucomicrobia bacterium]|nr:bifunctional folylpolyglutamate synthase/dihydrofolate synthase [Verrucomicrobiota bacterium]